MGRGASGIGKAGSQTAQNGVKSRFSGGIFENKINETSRIDMDDVVKDAKYFSKFDNEYPYESAIRSELAKDYEYVSQAKTRDDFIKRGDYIMEKWKKRIESDQYLDSFEDIDRHVDSNLGRFARILANEREYREYSRGMKSGKYQSWNDYAYQTRGKKDKWWDKWDYKWNWDNKWR